MIHLSVCHGNKYLSANFLKQTYFSNSSLLVIITPNVFFGKGHDERQFDGWIKGWLTAHSVLHFTKKNPFLTKKMLF